MTSTTDTDLTLPKRRSRRVAAKNHGTPNPNGDGNVGRALPADPSPDRAPLTARSDVNDQKAQPNDPSRDRQGAKKSPRRNRKKSNTPRRQAPAETTEAHRRRQVSVAAILDSIFGSLAEENPSLWDRRAYLMMVGLVYERMAVNEMEIPTDELIALAKILAENRRAEARLRDNTAGADESEAGSKDQPPEKLDDLIRQVYGANLHPTSPQPEGSS